MRSSRQVFDDHWDSILAGDMDRILSDYASDAVFVTPGRVARGHAGVQSVFEGIGADLGEMAFNQGIRDGRRFDDPVRMERHVRRGP